jgi:hypothetical protein
MVVPTELSVSIDAACDISLQCWRLRQLAELQKDSKDGAGLRHATSCITEALNTMGIEIIDLAGRIYDPGLVAEVVEVHHDETFPDGHAVIEETITPTVTWRGQVIKPGQIIVKRSPLPPAESSEIDP